MEPILETPEEEKALFDELSKKVFAQKVGSKERTKAAEEYIEAMTKRGCRIGDVYMKVLYGD